MTFRCEFKPTGLTASDFVYLYIPTLGHGHGVGIITGMEALHIFFILLTFFSTHLAL
jgi:hypothetical protein